MYQAGKKICFLRVNVIRKIIRFDVIMTAVPYYGFKAEDLIKQGRTTKSNIDEINRWLSVQKQYPRMPDEQIGLFLIACNNVIENTITTIQYHFKYKSSAPELFQNRDVDAKEQQHTRSVVHLAISPKRTKENYLVAYGGLKDTSYSSFILDNNVKAAFMLVDVALQSNPPDGLIFVLNMKGVGIMHLTRLKLGTLKKFISYVQDALPTQLRRVHVLNATYIFEKVLALIRPFMLKELFDLILAHPVDTDMNEFFEKHVSADCIPAEFGGNLANLDKLCDETYRIIKSLQSFLELEEKQIQFYKKNS